MRCPLIMLNTIMAKSTNIVKRKPGRPVEVVGGAREFLGVRLPSDLLKRVEQWAKRERVPKSEAVRALLERGLQL